MTQKHDYVAAIEWFTEISKYVDGNACIKATLHALTTLQAITSALPEGVDPVRLVKGLAAEPSEEVIGIGHSALMELFGDGDLDVTKADSHYVFDRLRAQLYREASEGAGE